jgi:hypothetical protein
MLPGTLEPRYITAIWIPVYLAGLTLFAKKLATGRKFKRNAFYMGIDQTVAAFAIPGVNLVKVYEEISRAVSQATPVTSVTWRALKMNAGATIIGVIFLFLVLSFHQDFESEDGPKGGEVFFVAILSNLVGFGFLFGCGLLLA